MKIYIYKKDILKSLKKIQAIAEKSSITPITSNVLMEAKKKTLVVSATNFEVGIILKQSAEVNREGKVVTDARKIYEIINEMPEEEIYIEKRDSGWVNISCGGKIIFNIVGLSDEEFPNIEIDSKIKFLEINAVNINELIKKTIYATSDDRTRDTLRGILVEKQKEGLRMVATDGHRLSLADRMFSTDEEPVIKRSVIIPQKGAREMKRLIEELDKEERIKIGLGEKSVVVKGEEETLVVRLIEGEFPNYKKVIPINNKNRMIVKTKDLIESLRRVSLVIEEDTKAIRLVVKPGILIISSKKTGLGDAREEIEIDYSGEDIEIGLNCKYVLDVLNTIEGEGVVFEMMDGKTPVLIKEREGEYNASVIMPMMI